MIPYFKPFEQERNWQKRRQDAQYRRVDGAMNNTSIALRLWWYHELEGFVGAEP